MEILPEHGIIKLIDLAKWSGVTPESLLTNLIKLQTPIYKAGKTKSTWFIKLSDLHQPGKEPKA